MTRRNPYAAHRDFARLALPHTHGWRLMVVIFGFELAFTLGPILLQSLSQAGAAGASVLSQETPLSTVLQFAIFGLSGLTLLALVRLVHHRGPGSLIGPGKPAWHDFRITALAVGLVLLVQEPILLWMWRAEIAEIRPLASWLFWLVPGVLALVVQVSTEELFFRGYLQQQFAALSSRRWVWIGVPSVVFGLGHAANAGHPVDALIWVIWATALGLACADLTARTGNIGAAIGLHLSNNIFAVMIVSVDGMPGSGLALFLYTEAPGLFIDTRPNTGEILLQTTIALMGVLVMWLAARVALRR